jgi:hypothetical protein
MNRAHQIVDALLETKIIGKDIPPPHFAGRGEEDVAQAARSPFTAYSHAVTTGKHHPRLWNAVKNSPFEKQYRQKFNPAD